MRYSFLAHKALSLHIKYKIVSYPIESYILEEMIYDYSAKIKHLNKFKEMCIIDDEILAPYPNCLSYAEYRWGLAHELAHLILHCSNYFYEKKSTISKREKQADALAAYILMPYGTFEESCLTDERNYYLAELYGVSEDLVSYRKNLISIPSSNPIMASHGRMFANHQKKELPEVNCL